MVGAHFYRLSGVCGMVSALLYPDQNITLIPRVEDLRLCCERQGQILNGVLSVAVWLLWQQKGDTNQGQTRVVGCSMVAKSKHKLKDHVKSHTQEKVVACPTCGSLFSNTTKFFDHIKRQTDTEGRSMLLFSQLSMYVSAYDGPVSPS